jgi:hypothetical protein
MFDRSNSNFLAGADKIIWGPFRGSLHGAGDLAETLVIKESPGQAD